MNAPAPADTTPCTCIPGITTEAEVKRFPIFDPYCPRDAVHREIAVLDHEPLYPAKNGYDPLFIAPTAEEAA